MRKWQCCRSWIFFFRLEGASLEGFPSILEVSLRTTVVFLRLAEVVVDPFSIVVMSETRSMLIVVSLDFFLRGATILPFAPIVSFGNLVSVAPPTLDATFRRITRSGFFVSFFEALWSTVFTTRAPYTAN